MSLKKIQRDCLNLVKENFILLRRISIEYNSSWNLNVLLLLFKKMIQTQKLILKVNLFVVCKSWDC